MLTRCSAHPSTLMARLHSSILSFRAVFHPEVEGQKESEGIITLSNDERFECDPLKVISVNSKAAVQ